MKLFSEISKYVVFLLLIVACKPKQNMVYMTNNNFEEEVSQARYKGLYIKEGDELEITVSAFDDIAVKPFNKSTMSQSEGGSGRTFVKDNYEVDSDGYINYPVLGKIYCKGMTKKQLKEDMESRLLDYLREPLVSINLNNFNISVLGDVKSPGQKTSPNERVNIFQALALAGDMNDSGNRTNVKLIRYSEEEQKDEVITLDISETSIVNSPYYYLQQNDILYIEPDKNKQIAANTTNPNRNLALQIGAALLGLATFIIALSR